MAAVTAAGQTASDYRAVDSLLGQVVASCHTQWCSVDVLQTIPETWHPIRWF